MKERLLDKSEEKIKVKYSYIKKKKYISCIFISYKSLFQRFRFASFFPFLSHFFETVDLTSALAPFLISSLHMYKRDAAKTLWKIFVLIPL